MKHTIKPDWQDAIFSNDEVADDFRYYHGKVLTSKEGIIERVRIFTHPLETIEMAYDPRDLMRMGITKLEYYVRYAADFLDDIPKRRS